MDQSKQRKGIVYLRSDEQYIVRSLRTLAMLA
jgi:hypothetical protein